MSHTRPEPLACEEARPLLSERLDADLDPRASDRLDAHLEGCPACRAYGEDLETLRRGLRNLPRAPLGEADRAALLEELPPAARAGKSRRPSRLWLLPAAAALVLAVSLGWWLRHDELEPAADAEAQRAAAEVRMVLALAGRAVDRSEEAVVEDVLAREVSPALERVPLGEPETGAGSAARSER